MARKLALIIGNSQYEDAALARLAAPDVDVRALAEVLCTPGIGAFDEVVPLLNEGLATVRRAIARFFDAKHRDDLLFFYFSGHGVRDERGHLYLAVRDTERAILAGTAIEASYVTTRMDRSASKRMVLVLDCCHSGAFGYGAKAAQGATVGTATAFEGTGRGRVVLTATDSTQYAWEGDQVLGEGENSLFSHYMIEGLRTGAADRDEDGLITIDELYDYVYEHVLNDTPKQTPGKWAFGQQGEIVIAHNTAASRTKLPEIEEAVRNTLPSVRLEAVRELDIILRGRHAGRSNAAREVLKRLAEDDSRRVAAAAVEMLKAFELGGRPVQPETIAREIEIEKKKEVERGETARVEAAQVKAALEAARVEAARIEAARVEAAGVERRRAKRLERYVAKGKAALQQKRYKEALEFAEKGATLDPDHEAVRGLMDRIHASVEEASRRIDDNVQFTVYRPAAMAPQRWYPLLFFTHLSERRSDAPPGEPDPKTQVETQAEHLLGSAVSSFSRIAQDADVRIPHEALLQINPKIPDVVFNPPEYSFLLLESVHRADFKVRANASLEGRIARGTIEVRMGAIPVAVVTVAIPIDARAPVDEPPVHDVVHPYRRIFASYSHKDQKIVQQFEKYAQGIGDSYMRDVIHLRAGEIWNTRLLEMIDSADVFQLFWSTNSMHSPFVRREWEHALTVDKSYFVRPLYWETPFPEAEGLPPPELKRHHFATVAIGEIRDRGTVERHYEPPRSSAEQVEAERVEAARVEAERVARVAAVTEQLVAAESALGRGALDDARERLTKALEIEPQHAGALQLQRTLQQRIEERTRLAEAEQRIRELRQKIGTLIARANATDSDAEAIALLDEALGLDPEHAEVKELLEERHRLRAEAEAAERRARSIATVQERIARHLERGDLEEAERALVSAEALGAPAEVFAPLRERLAHLHDQRRRDAEEAIRLKAEAEKRARADEIARHLESARKAIGQQRFDEALETLRQASAPDAKAPGIAELVSRAEAGKAALEAEAKKRQEIDTQLNQASQHLTKGHLTKAIVITDVLLGLDPNHPAAKLLHEQIQKAIEGQKQADRKAAQERERQRQIDDMIATAEAAPTHDTAIEILNDVLRRDPGNAKAGRLLDKRQADLDALKAEQRRSEIAAAQQTIEEHLTRNELDLAGTELDAAEGRFQSTAEFRALRERLQAAVSLRAEVQHALEEEAKHPVKGFSLRPALSSQWRTATVTVVLVAILALTLAFARC